MSIRYEHQETIKADPTKVFETIDDLPLTAKWLPPCISLSKVGDGPNATGDKLHYVFEQGGRKSEMEGVILNRVAGERLHSQYSDDSFEVMVDLRVASSPEGTLSTHIIEITPKTFAGKLMKPLIKLGLGKQTRDAAANLRKLVEQGTV
ncbi:MAG: SRPBCC family protein [Pirellulales bacterium]